MIKKVGIIRGVGGGGYSRGGELLFQDGYFAKKLSKFGISHDDANGIDIW